MSGASKKAASAAGAALSKLGAAKGGRARAAKLTQEERRDIAARAARARWNPSDGGGSMSEKPQKPYEAGTRSGDRKGSPYSNYVRLESDGRWHVALKNKRFDESYETLDDAIDALLMEESCACARVLNPVIKQMEDMAPWEAYRDRAEADQATARHGSALRLVREAHSKILERQKQELGDG